MKALAELETEPWSFDFHTALRRIECAYQTARRMGSPCTLLKSRCVSGKIRRWVSLLLRF